MKVQVKRLDNCIYLLQDISDLNLYQRAKAIKNFINNETLILEEMIDYEIRAIFERNGISIKDQSESALNRAFDRLGKEIEIKDLYNQEDLFGCVVLGKSKGDIIVVLEDNKLLQCGCLVEERETQ